MKRLLLLIVLTCMYAVNTLAQSNSDIVQGVIRIKLKPDVITTGEGLKITTKKNNIVTGIKSLDAINLKNGVQHMKRVFPYSPKFEDRHIKYGLKDCHAKI